MFNKRTVKDFWDKRVFIKQKAFYPDPCHYMNRYQDRYIWKQRTSALKKLKKFFQKKRVIDIGCGYGTYTTFLGTLGPSHLVGIDRADLLPTNTPKGVSKFVPGQVTKNDITSSLGYYIRESDVVTLLTVYDYLPIENREELRALCCGMEQGSYVMILDLNRDSIPEFQKNLSYKQVETKSKKIHDFFKAGFDLETEVPVNYIDSRIFHYLGRNWFSEKLSLFVDWLLKDLTEPMYTILVFRKL